MKLSQLFTAVAQSNGWDEDQIQKHLAAAQFTDDSEFTPLEAVAVATVIQDAIFGPPPAVPFPVSKIKQ